MRTCPRKAEFFTLKSATNLIHFSWSKTVEIGEKEEEVQTDQGAGNDNAMGVLFSPEDGEALDEQLVGSIDDEEGDMRPLNLDFGDADVDDDDQDDHDKLVKLINKDVSVVTFSIVVEIRRVTCKRYTYVNAKKKE